MQDLVCLHTIFRSSELVNWHFKGKKLSSGKTLRCNGERGERHLEAAWLRWHRSKPLSCWQALSLPMLIGNRIEKALLSHLNVEIHSYLNCYSQWSIQQEEFKLRLLFPLCLDLQHCSASSSRPSIALSYRWLTYGIRTLGIFLYNSERRLESVSEHFASARPKAHFWTASEILTILTKVFTWSIDFDECRAKIMVSL